jgi:hypothetical protein
VYTWLGGYETQARRPLSRREKVPQVPACAVRCLQRGTGALPPRHCRLGRQGGRVRRWCNQAGARTQLQFRPADTRGGARLLRAGETQVWCQTPARLAYASLASHFPRPLVPPVPSLDPLARLAELDPFPRDLYCTVVPGRQARCLCSRSLRRASRSIMTSARRSAKAPLVSYVPRQFRLD